MRHAKEAKELRKIFHFYYTDEEKTDLKNNFHTHTWKPFVFLSDSFIKNSCHGSSTIF